MQPVQRLPVNNNSWQSVTPEDARVARPTMAVSLSPNVLIDHQVCAVPRGVLTQIFNIILW